MLALRIRLLGEFTCNILRVCVGFLSVLLMYCCMECVLYCKQHCKSSVNVFSCCLYNTHLPDIPYFFKSHFNFIIPSKRMASKLSLFLGFFHQNPS
jgi:hypothetical protein